MTTTRPAPEPGQPGPDAGRPCPDGIHRHTPAVALDCARCHPDGHDQCGCAARVAAEALSDLPVGTPVRYWRGARTGPGIPSRTRSAPWRLAGHTLVVLVDGHVGAVALTHIQPTDQPVAEPATIGARP